MGKTNCCIKNCKNTGRNSDVDFFKFPRAKHKIDQRTKWINVVRKVNPVASDWLPTASDTICSDHFIKNMKSDNPLAPNYVPKIFDKMPSSTVANLTAAVQRHDRFVKRRTAKQNISPKQNKTKKKQTDVLSDNSLVDDKQYHASEGLQTMHSVMTANDVESVEMSTDDKKCFDKSCQVEIFWKNCSVENVLICNRYIYMGAAGSIYGDAETQTEIRQSSNILTVQQKTMKNQSCGTPHRIFQDEAIQTDQDAPETYKAMFQGIISVKKDQQLLDLCGVSFIHFNFLLKRISSCDSEKFKVGVKDRLFIFLMKMKTGLTFSALSVLFSIHRSTISRIFFSVLDDLVVATANLVYWPSKDVVKDTMPAFFHPRYSNTRVIIDCTEFRIETPSKVDDRVYCYSQYKKGLTAKVLIGATPGGFISFKSKVSGGRKTDSQITVESNLLDFLEHGDTVLADKGFPQFQQVIDKSGKKVMLVMPPFLENNHEFTEDQTKETYSIASIRIHIERIMQRLRIYQILNKIPHNLMNSLDDIVHVACVLVNLQPPIIKSQ